MIWNDDAEFDDDIEIPKDGDLLRQLEGLDEPERKPIVAPARQPMFQTLFAASIEDPNDHVLHDFARLVVGKLSDHFALTAAKGGAFFRQKEAEGAENTERYGRDQTLRAHLINGMLPALRIARCLHRWKAPPMRHWDEMAERLFIAGYMLHDFTKIQGVKETLKDKGFAENEAPSERQIPTLEDIFRDWCAKLGLDAFLQPIGSVNDLVQDLIYVALNTQQLWGTAHAPRVLPNISTEANTYLRAATVSHLADLMAYVARTPMEMVAHKSIRTVLEELGYDLASRAMIGRLVYHHVAENRGLLLNFIHDGVLAALTIPDQRVPLLYAPSGVVYLERHDAPPIPDLQELTAQIVTNIRRKAGERLISTGKGAKRGNVGLQVDDSYDDYFSLPDFIRSSVRIVERYVRNNKSANRLEPIRQGDWLAGQAVPSPLEGPKDVRLDQLAEWAGLLETKFRERLEGFDLTDWLLKAWEIDDLRVGFDIIRNHPEARKGGGIKFWWFWAAAEVIARQPTLNPDDTLAWIEDLSNRLADALGTDLPQSAQANEGTWEDLADYVRQVLSVGGAKVDVHRRHGELARYVRAKAGRGGAVCAICGAEYQTRKPAETAVAFQPGVYTARIKIGGSDNKRSLCSICALEQLLRQLFVDNLDSGGTAEGQRIRYLSFYPSYFFTPETLRFMRRVYQLLKDVRLSDRDLRRALNEHDLTDPVFWQRLEPFLLRSPDDEASKRVLRYGEGADATFLMVGFRSFNDPADSESWVIPAFLSLVLPICLDVKVVASEGDVRGSTPIMLESDELAETVWFDGAHAAILSLVGESRIHIDALRSALARLAAAYAIHLDTEYAPPKENWHRLSPIAHTLMESPLYVFHYLKKQERDGQPIGMDRIHRYVYYAESIFNPQGDRLMSHARELVELYRGFYRAKNIENANSILRPLSVVADTLLTADPRLFSDEDALIEITYGELYRFMDRVSTGQADGRFPKGISPAERDQSMRLFCTKFVRDVFLGVFNGDVAALRGKQLNLLRSACEVLYRDMQREEWAARGRDADESEEDEIKV